MYMLILIYNTLESQNIMNTYLILFGTSLTWKTAVNLHWHRCHKSSVDGQQIASDVQAVLASIWDIHFLCTLSCRSLTPQIYFIRLRSGESGGMAINWNSSLCSWKHPSTVPVLWSGMLLFWKILFPIGNIAFM